MDVGFARRFVWGRRFAFAIAASTLRSMSNRLSARVRAFALLVVAALVASPAAADAPQGTTKEKEITLERLFPEKSFFGPSASGAAFSSDGRYAAYLYRPWIERRHGSDLWIHDFETGETRRVTMVSVMSAFQEDARKVRDDRVKKAKEARKAEQAPKGDGAAKPAPVEPAQGPDPIAGVWEGTLTGDGVAVVPPEGIAVTIEIERSADGAVSGVARSSLGTVALSEAEFDAASGRFACTLRMEQPPATARMELRIDGEAAKGEVTVDGLEGTLRLELARVRATVPPPAASGAEETAAAATAPTTAPEGPAIVDGVARETARDLGDWVDAKDADAESAPRYGGLSGFVWSPTAPELLFTAAGDLYRLHVGATAAEDRIERLTRTREDERSVEYLPDGSGYTYMRGEDLLRVSFAADATAAGRIEQINPRLPSGERMTGYRVSPDGLRLVFLATKGESREGRRVNIVSYRDRFAQVQQVPRTTSDDPVPEVEESVYLYDLEGHLAERGAMRKVFARKRTGPRDVLRVPEWSGDSSRVAFAVFEQASGRVEIMEAIFAPKETPKSDAPAKAEEPDAPKPKEEERAEAPPPASLLARLSEPAKDAELAFEIRDAKPVHRFLHNGGPNTPGLIRPRYLADGRRLVFLAETSGFRQFHVLDPTYEHVEPLTRGRFELVPLEMSRDRLRLYAVGTREGPEQQQVYRIDLETGAMERISRLDGSHDAVAVSEDGTRLLANHVDFGSLRELHASSGDRIVRLTDSHTDEARALTAAKPEYFSYLNRHGQRIHGHLFKPDDWSPQDKRPLLVYVYGGPLGQRNMAARGAHEAASYFFAWYMAKRHGYVTCTIDPRGASGYGGLFEKSNYEQVGKPQVEDLVDGVRWFVAEQGVDPKRVGLHGWSFGGFQTQMCMYTEPDVFAVGIAGAGPTEWENYNAWYSTGTIGPSRTGETDLAKFSLLPLAKNLKGRLLLVHGVEDSNVLYQDTVRVYRELLKAGKEALVDLFIDPTGGHGLGGDVKNLNRYRKYEAFLVQHLGRGEPAPKEERPAEAPPAPAHEAGNGDATKEGASVDAVEPLPSASPLGVSPCFASADSFPLPWRPSRAPRRSPPT